MAKKLKVTQKLVDELRERLRREECAGYELKSETSELRKKKESLEWQLRDAQVGVSNMQGHLDGMREMMARFGLAGRVEYGQDKACAGERPFNG